MSEEERVPVSWEEAVKRLNIIPDYDAGSGPGPCVHTLVESPIGLIGAHWTLYDLAQAVLRWGCEEAGPVASSMDYGLVILSDAEAGGPLFLETKP